MTKIGFVACSKKKLRHPAPAGALYNSPLFRKSLLAALRANDVVYILSALHGLLPLHKVIAPYDATLKAMSASERAAWAEGVAPQLEKVIRPGDTATFYSGEEYIRPLRPLLGRIGCKVFEPLAGLSFGSRLSRLQKRNEENDLRRLMKESRGLLRCLWLAQLGGRTFAECSRAVKWPQKGLYIVLDDVAGHGTMPRVTRIGTHAVSMGSKSSLWNRLSTHRGTLKGGGSHRSSIFRSHVGRAIMRSTTDQSWPQSWGRGQSAPKEIRDGEADLEHRVSAYIANLRLIWLDIPDDAGPDSDRAYIERNLIAVYSRVGLLFPSIIGHWLGEWSPEWRIASTGLWNLDHVLADADDAFPRILEHYVETTLGRRPATTSRVAPDGWRLRRNVSRQQQLVFSEQRRV